MYHLFQTSFSQLFESITWGIWVISRKDWLAALRKGKLLEGSGQLRIEGRTALDRRNYGVSSGCSRWDWSQASFCPCATWLESRRTVNFDRQAHQDDTVLGKIISQGGGGRMGDCHQKKEEWIQDRGKNGSSANTFLMIPSGLCSVGLKPSNLHITYYICISRWLKPYLWKIFEIQENVGIFGNVSHGNVLLLRHPSYCFCCHGYIDLGYIIPKRGSCNTAGQFGVSLGNG